MSVAYTNHSSGKLNRHARTGLYREGCWKACWRLDLMEQQSQMMNATASLMSLEASLEEEWPAAILKDVTLQKTTGEQIVELQNAALFLETLWLSDPQLQQDIDADA